ncbi:biotin-dependent carboxyltransferase family protein [Ectobacillus funiculus]|uniref:5-oxoprolinase subunit C family protein n=1 Tax=Ectobacillus funiculus TaxID=137993 RepID=UPI00397A7AC5
MTIQIIRPGLCTSVQDLGRYGYRKQGVVVSGAMDTTALRIGNRLVGNEEAAAALEVTLVGPKLLFEKDTLISICGGDLSPHIDGCIVPLWRPVLVKSGSILQFGAPKLGCRSYIAVAGGIDVPTVMGSSSTYIRGEFGGLEGRNVKEGDRLFIGKASELVCCFVRQLSDGEKKSFSAAKWGFSSTLLPAYSSRSIVRMIRGPQFEWFTERAQEELFARSFHITTNSDRMGYRLGGGKLELQGAAELFSEAVSIGTIQVPPEGNPIVLMADCQTTGGYPNIGYVVSVDIPILAQLKPGDFVSFQEISLGQAHMLMLAQEKLLKLAARGILWKGKG